MVTTEGVASKLMRGSEAPKTECRRFPIRSHDNAFLFRRLLDAVRIELDSIRFPTI